MQLGFDPLSCKNPSRIFHSIGTVKVAPGLFDVNFLFFFNNSGLFFFAFSFYRDRDGNRWVGVGVGAGAVVGIGCGGCFYIFC